VIFVEVSTWRRGRSKSRPLYFRRDDWNDVMKEIGDDLFHRISDDMVKVCIKQISEAEYTKHTHPEY
jgi:hypothetical protein